MFTGFAIFTFSLFEVVLAFSHFHDHATPEMQSTVDLFNIVEVVYKIIFKMVGIHVNCCECC